MQELMRAAVLHSPGDVRIENVARPEVRAGHALVRVAACGVCGSDIPRILTKGAHKLPLIPGHEFSGHIEGLGAEMDDWTEGELVAIPPLIPCFKCSECLRGFPSRCTDYDYFGSRRDGAYTEYVSVPKSNLLRVPPGMDATAAAFADPAAFALHAIRTTNLTLSQRVAVVGCGPNGQPPRPAILWMDARADAESRLAREVANELGIKSSPIVVQGGIDAHTAMLGAATIEPGELLIQGGTSVVHLTQTLTPKYAQGIWGPYPSALLEGSGVGSYFASTCTR